MKVKSRSQAREDGDRHYFTGKPCFRGGIGKRLTSTANCWCDVCLPFIKNRKKNEYKSNRDNPEWIEKEKQKRIKNKKSKSEYDRGYRERTREKQAEWNRNWVKNNKEKRRAIPQNYKAKRRAQEESGVSSLQLAEWKEKQIKKCYWCGSECIHNYHVDHYIPLSKGGLHELDNMVISCPHCNLTKNAKDPYEFALSKGMLF